MSAGQSNYMHGDGSGPVIMQPVSTMEKVVIVTDNPVNRVPPGQWTTGLCGCFEDIGSCMAAFFCLPFYRCYLSDKMGEHCCMPMCVGSDLTILRMKLRTMRNIPGGAISDCCASLWCGCCTAAQLSREWDNSVVVRK